MNIMKYRYLYFLISLLVLIPGIFSLVRHGLRLGIDFTGGSLVEVHFIEKNPTQTEITEALQPVYEVVTVQESGDQTVIIRGKELDNATKDQALSRLNERFGLIEEKQFATVGPALSQELLKKTTAAVILVVGFIVIYIWRQFNNLRFGISAVLAVLHDTLVLLGVFSLLGYLYGIEVDILFVTALLTTLSFSVHDTIVVFHRINELHRKHPKQKFEDTVGAAVLETLGRSINNSMTIIIMLLSLVLFGGQTIQNFSLALLIGAITGTYSSSFMAAPLLVEFDKIGKKTKS